MDYRDLETVCLLGSSICAVFLVVVYRYSDRFTTINVLVVLNLDFKNA